MSCGTVFAFRGGSRLGPFSVEEARLLVESGEIKSSETLVIGGRSLAAVEFLALLAEPGGFDRWQSQPEEPETPRNPILPAAAHPPDQRERRPLSPPKIFPRLARETISLQGATILGYLCSGLALLFFPPVTGAVAFFSGIFILLRGRVSHGVAIILVSLAATLAGISLGAASHSHDKIGTAMDLPAIHAATVPAVVQVSALNSKGEVVKTGTGFSIENGMIVTNYHVVKGASDVQITMSDGSDSGCREIVALDRVRDLAIFVPETCPAKALRIALEAAPPEGERVAVIGNPLGFSGTLSDGIVSANRTDDNGVDLIQITAPISHGSSGSPVVNSRGEVLGIATMIFSGGQNLNFAVSAREIAKVLKAKAGNGGK